MGQVNSSNAEGVWRRFSTFIAHHTKEIQKGGWSILVRKLRTFFRFPYLALQLLTLLPIWPIVLIIRLLRPFVLIRFGHLRSRNIGHFAGNTELYLCRRDAGIEAQDTFDIFYHQRPVCNQQLKIMWERILRVSRLVQLLDFVNRALPGGGIHRITEPPRGDFDIHGLLMMTPPHLSFTAGEEVHGQEELRVMGIPEGKQFICFHARDFAYHKSVAPDRDFSHTDYRSSVVHNHILAAEEMTRRGYYAIRMGATVDKALRTNNPMIIDYATQYRSDFMDIFLGANCYFYIGDQSGLDSIPGIFRKPVATVNLSQFQRARTWSPQDLFIPKKLLLRRENRQVTFREIFDWQIDDVRRAEQYEQWGIEVIENTPEEITSLAVEMNERLQGTWHTTAEDEELQRRFWEIYQPSELFHGEIKSHIGAEFLRQNRKLLE